MSIGRVADARPIPTGTAAEREMRGFLRRLVREGFTGSDAQEQVVCWYCFEPHRGKRTQHAKHCLYVRAKELLAKYPASRG